MRKTDRVVVFIVGFLLGTVLVSAILMRRSLLDGERDPWERHQEEAAEAGAPALPERVPESIHEGRLLSFGYLPSGEKRKERVWLLRFEDRYPHVRVVEDLETGALRYMAADQIVLEMADGVDVTELRPMLEELGLQLRMFNRGEGVAVISVLGRSIDAVPETLDAVRPWSGLFSSARPDELRFREKTGGNQT